MKVRFCEHMKRGQNQHAILLQISIIIIIILHINNIVPTCDNNCLYNYYYIHVRSIKESNMIIILLAGYSNRLGLFLGYSNIH